MMDWTLLAGLWFVVAMAAPAYCCCGCTCANCTGRTPQYVQIEFSGVANGGCSECTSLNGVWILEQRTLQAQCCTYFLDMDPNLCSDQIGQMVFTHTFFETLLLRSDAAATAALWNDDEFTEPRDCLDEYELEFDQQFVGCNFTGATVTVNGL